MKNKKNIIVIIMGVFIIALAIFLNCWRGPDSPTGGCVGISEENMIKVLKTVVPGTSVTIY